VSNFDTVFTTEQPLDSVVEGSQLSQTVQAQFEGAFPRLFPDDKPNSTPCGAFLCRLLVQRARTHCACGLNGPRSSPPPHPNQHPIAFVKFCSQSATIVIWRPGSCFSFPSLSHGFEPLDHITPLLHMMPQAFILGCLIVPCDLLRTNPPHIAHLLHSSQMRFLPACHMLP
jgi:hypothetical protein